MVNSLPHASRSVFERCESRVRSYGRNVPTVFASAQGSTMVDENGRPYIDFLAGCASLNYGHNDPDMKAALLAHIEGNGLAQGLDLETTTKRRFLETFENLVLSPRGLDYRIQFTGPTGTNAVEAALKLARKVTGRANVVAFTNGYHGMTLGALAATGNQGHRTVANGMLPNISRAAFDGYYGEDIDTIALLERQLDDPASGLDAPAAILLETIQGEGGLNAATIPWLKRLAELAKRHGALLIVDDIQAGCGRSSRFFSFEEAGIVPDLVVLSKSLSGFGLPLSILLIHPEHDIWNPAEHNGTFRGNTHAFVTARVALEKFWSSDDLTHEINRKAGVVTAALKALSDEFPGTRVKGRGMMRGLDVGSGELAGKICHRCFDKGLVIETSGAFDEVVKILAPLTTPDECLEEGLSILSQAVRHSMPTETSVYA